MYNPLHLLWLMLKARRPRSIADMPVVLNAFWLRRGYDALTFFGTIVVRSADVARQMGHRGDCLKNHEMIHLWQAQHTYNSWLCFYGLYLWYYVKDMWAVARLKLQGKGEMLRGHGPYELNPFEMEAYAHMDDLGYSGQACCGLAWRHYAAMTIEQRAADIGGTGR